MSFGKPPEKRTFFWKHNTILHKTRNKIKRFSEKIRLSMCIWAFFAIFSGFSSPPGFIRQHPEQDIHSYLYRT
jgi:hypothetical protein